MSETFLAPTAPGRHKAPYSRINEYATAEFQRIVHAWITESNAPKHRAEVAS